MMTTAPRTWTQYAHRTGREPGEGTDFVSVYPWPHSVRMSFPGEPIVELVAIEDPEGEYAGWLDANKDGVLNMVQHHRIFNIQFPYGVKVAVDAGDGEAVRLRLEEVRP